jgi:hypothetical protein
MMIDFAFIWQLSRPEYAKRTVPSQTSVPLTLPAISASPHTVRALLMNPDGVTMRFPRVSIGRDVGEETVTSDSSIAAWHSGQEVVRACPDTSWTWSQ